MNRLQPLLPETRSKNGCNSSSMHRPMVVFSMLALGSICHHLQSLHNPQESVDGLLAMALPLKHVFAICQSHGRSWLPVARTVPSTGRIRVLGSACHAGHSRNRPDLSLSRSALKN